MGRVVISDNASGASTITAAKTGYSTVVTSLFLISGGTVNVTFEDSAGADLHGPVPLVANAGFVLPYNPEGWFETASGKGLSLLTDANIQVSGAVNYNHRKV